MHEVLLLGIAASELTVLLTSDPRRWSRRLSLFLTLLLAVICYAWFVLGVSALANALGATLAIVWFAWDLVDPSARGVLGRWALASIGFVVLLSLSPGGLMHPSCPRCPRRCRRTATKPARDRTSLSLPSSLVRCLSSPVVAMSRMK